MDNLTSDLSKINVNDDKISVYNFIQGGIGNCGMISSMSLLANNKDLYNKVVPTRQNFDSKNSSKVMFNIYKLGKLYKVEVSKTLLTKDNRLISCRSYNDNLVGPLLEKALVNLHFDGNYKAADGVTAAFVMSSLTNNFFEEVHSLKNNCFYSSFIIFEYIEYGLKTKSQMVVSFKHEQASLLNLKIDHYYSLLDEKKKENNLVKFYDPHGKIVSMSKKDFVKAIEKFEICYSENKIFGIPEIKTYVNYFDKWATLKRNEKMYFVAYDLTVSEKYTEILINIIPNKLSTDIKPAIFMITNEKKVIKSSLSFVTENSKIIFYHKQSLRQSFKRGNHKIVVVLSSYGKLESCEECENYLKNGGKKFLFRLAASKKCIVAKPLKKKTCEIEKVLFDWHVRTENKLPKNY